jgi:ATP-binding cassette subfamily B protein
MQAATETKPKKITAGDVLRTYNRLLRGFRWPFAVEYTLIIVASALGLGFPWFYKALLDAIANPALTRDAASAVAMTALFWIAVLHLAMYAVWRSSGFFAVWMYPTANARLNVSAFSYLMRHSYRYFTNQFVGSLTRRVHRFIDAFGQISDIFQWEMLPTAVTLIGASIALSLRNLVLGGLLIGWASVYIVVNYKLGQWKLRYDEELGEKDSAVAATLSDVMANSINVKSFAAYGGEETRYRGVVATHLKIWRFSWNISEAIMAIQAMLYIVFEIVMWYASIRLWRAGLITIGDFALIQAYVLSVFRQLWDFGRNLRRMFQLIGEAAEMVETFELPHEVVDVEDAKTLVVDKGAIEFKSVSFGYREDRGVLNRFDLSIVPGEKIALVGPSGAGKTTVTKLLMRFFDVKEGAILIDGQDIAKVTQESLWQAIGFVPQDPVLFHRSLMENIRYGKPGATDEEVFEAAKKARCHNFISELANGYDTLVGERGVKLSGGERQRVAIARAILKNAPILVLDEATSSLDSESEQTIQESLAELMKGKTVIVIAHRLSTIMKMDRILVMENGKVAEQGTHKELLKEVGTYQRLWHIQAGGFQPK